MGEFLVIAHIITARLKRNIKLVKTNPYRWAKRQTGNGLALKISEA